MKQAVLILMLFCGFSACTSVPEYPYSRETGFQIGDDKLLTPTRRVRLKAQLDEQKAIWAANRLDDYHYILEKSCYCLYGPAYGPNIVRVRDGNVKSIIYRGERRDGFKSGDKLLGNAVLDYSIDELFEKVEKVLSGQSLISERFNQREVMENFAVTYDETFGFPVRISYDRLLTADEEYVVLLKGFKAL